MNANRRKEADKIHEEMAALLEKIKAIDFAEIDNELGDLRNRLEYVRDEEQEAFNNMPESLQQGEKGQAMEENCNAFGEAVDALESVQSALEDVISEPAEELETAINRLNDIAS